MKREHAPAWTWAAVAALGALLLGAETAKLSRAYDLWLNQQVRYIVSPRERKVFLQLKSDGERDAFIAAFWRQRDPTPGTEENEYRNEHQRRLEHADRIYGRGTSTPGWRTDRGRVYILLGDPLYIQNYSSFGKVYPCEIWHYQGMERFGLPTAFNLLFYDKRGRGEYVIYSPIGDGPHNLIVGFDGKIDDFQYIYDTINQYNTALAANAFSLVPGEGMAEGRPTMSSEILLQNIAHVPQRQVKDIYAERFLQYKDTVSIDYSTRFFESRSLVQPVLLPSGRALVYTLIQVDRLSVNLYEGAYSTELKLDGRVTTPAGEEIYQFSKTYEIHLDEEQVRRVNDSALVLLDAIPLIPGQYHLQLLLRNETSKEFTSVEKDLSVPDSFPRLQLSVPLLGYDLKRDNAAPAALTPFHVGTGQLLVAADSIFTRQDTLWGFAQLLGGDEGIKERLQLQVTIWRNPPQEKVWEKSQPLNEVLRGGGNLLLEIPLKELTPGYYQLRLALFAAEGQKLASTAGDFMITPMMQVNRPQIYFKTQRSPGDSMIDFILGSQHLNAGDPGSARPLLESAYNQAPGVAPFALAFARLLFEQKEYERLESILAPLSEAEKPVQEALLLLGRKRLDLKEWHPALAVHQKIIRHFGDIVAVWNDIGRCHLQLGERAEARRAWERSLALNPDQPQIRALLEEVPR